MGFVGPMEIVILGILAVLIFGPAKLPEIGRSLGRTAREFKESVSGMEGAKEAMDSVGEVRSAMTPSNLMKAAVPGVDEMSSSVDEVKKELGIESSQESDDSRSSTESETTVDADAMIEARKETPVRVSNE